MATQLGYVNQPIKNTKAPSVKIILENYQDYIKDIDDKRNIYFMGFHGKWFANRRVWESQETISFDIDHIIAGREEEYVEIVCKLLKIDRKKTFIVMTGYGLQFHIMLNEPFTDKTIFDKFKPAYDLKCREITHALNKAGLISTHLEGTKEVTTDVDTKVWSANRILRMPGTINDKANMPGEVKKDPDKRADRPARENYVIEKEITPQVSLEGLLGLPAQKENNTQPIAGSSTSTIDTDYVKSECRFLARGFAANGKDMNEEQWRAGLGLVYLMSDAEKQAHEWSHAHPGYDSEETLIKLERSKLFAKPRTCESISSICSDCKECPHFGGITSPVQLKSPTFIKTKGSGFRNLNSKGKRAGVNHLDLAKHFYDDHSFVVHPQSKDIYVHNCTQYNKASDIEIHAYAEEHVSPDPNTAECNEFYNKLTRFKEAILKDPDSFFDTTGLLNHSNGVRMKDGTIEEHGPRFGFRSTRNYPYEPDATAPLFTRALAQWLPDPLDREVILRFFGYTLFNDPCRAATVLILEGEGSNGKSTLVNIMRAVIGSGVKALGTADFANTHHLVHLDGSLLNILEELPAFNKYGFWELIKNLSAGALVTASEKYGRAYSFVNRCKFVFNTNRLGSGTTPSHGFYRRLLIVPFEQKFGAADRDPFLEDKIIENELPGIANMLIAARERLIENNYQFQMSDGMKRRLETFKQENDTVLSWQLEKSKNEEGGFTAFDDAFSHYKFWCDGKHVGRNEFRRRMKLILGDDRYGRSSGGDRKYGFHDLRVGD